VSHLHATCEEYKQNNFYLEEPCTIATAKLVRLDILTKVPKKYFILYYANVGVKNPEREKRNVVHIAHPTYLLSCISLPNPPTMPCVVQPCGGGWNMHVHYTSRKKHGLVAASKHMQAQVFFCCVLTHQNCVLALPIFRSGRRRGSAKLITRTRSLGQRRRRPTVARSAS
jgi:hypothetical protein